MTTTYTWTAPGTVQTYLTTELNSLASGSGVLGADIDNATAKATYMGVEILVAQQGSARAAGAYIQLFVIPSIDGTNYGDINAGSSSYLVQQWPLDAAVTARYLVARDIPIPPFHFKRSLHPISSVMILICYFSASSFCAVTAMSRKTNEVSDRGPH